MSTDIIVNGKGRLVTQLEKKGASELLKPLIREIHLFDSYVSGTAFIEDENVLAEINAGDSLSLIREESRFDENAIAIITDTEKRIGYVPEKDDLIFARLMDAGKKLTAKVNSVEKAGSVYRISIGIYLVDF